MKYSIYLILVMFSIFACKKEDESVIQLNDVCKFKTGAKAPVGHNIQEIGKIDFDGSVKSFQFLDSLTGYALMTKNYGGFVELFKP
jgi:hypothetical protein